MKMSEIRQMNGEELQLELERLRRHRFDIRAQAVTEKLVDPSLLTKGRRDIARVLTEIARRHQNDQVVVVTHGAFLIPFFEFVLGIPPGDESRFKRYNASYNVFEYSTGDVHLPGSGKWSLVTWNDISHFDEL